MPCVYAFPDIAIVDGQIIEAERIIEVQPDGKCELCGAEKELRPYGPNGENVCFPCGMKDEEAAKRRFLGDL